MSVSDPVRRMLPRRSRQERRSPQGEMSLIEHLTELRHRLFVSVSAMAVVFALAIAFKNRIFHFLVQPYCRTSVAKADNCTLINIHVTDQFQTLLHVALITAVVGSAPVWLYQLGAFIAPALHPKEKRWAGGFFVVSLALFAVGATFAYLTIDRGLEFLLTVISGVNPQLTVQSYLNFVTLTLLAFGVSFEFPVLLVFLNVVGLLSVQQMRHWRRAMIFAIAVFTAVITPSQDPITFMIMAIPLALMYEVVILIAAVRARRARRREIASRGYEEIGDDEISPLDERPRPLG